VRPNCVEGRGIWRERAREGREGFSGKRKEAWRGVHADWASSGARELQAG
jgi:hypothetical protein